MWSCSRMRKRPGGGSSVSWSAWRSAWVRTMSGLSVPQRPCEGPLPEAGDDAGGRFVLQRLAEESAADVGDLKEASPVRRRWATAWMQLQAFRVEEAQVRAGSHFRQAEPMRELQSARRDLEEARRHRERERPGEWRDGDLERELEDLVERPDVSFADVREHLRDRGISSPPPRLAEWWTALKRERAARLAVTAREERLRQVTDACHAESERRRSEAAVELEDARRALAEEILEVKSQPLALGADGRWPGGEVRRRWFRRRFLRSGGLASG
jgi:hypothetical protein